MPCLPITRSSQANAVLSYAMLCSVRFLKPSPLDMCASRSHLNPLDHLPDPLLSQLPLQAWIARLHELDDALGVFTSGREGFELGFVHIIPAVWLLGACRFGGSGGTLCSFRVKGGHDDRVLV